MPPYKPVVSKSQSRALFAKAERGEGISEEDARGKTAVADWKRLPNRVKVGAKTGRAPKRSPSRA